MRRAVAEAPIRSTEWVKNYKPEKQKTNIQMSLHNIQHVKHFVDDFAGNETALFCVNVLVVRHVEKR